MEQPSDFDNTMTKRKNINVIKKGKVRQRAPEVWTSLFPHETPVVKKIWFYFRVSSIPVREMFVGCGNIRLVELTLLCTLKRLDSKTSALLKLCWKQEHLFEYFKVQMIIYGIVMNAAVAASVERPLSVQKVVSLPGAQWKNIEGKKTIQNDLPISSSVSTS